MKLPGMKWMDSFPSLGTQVSRKAIISPGINTHNKSQEQSVLLLTELVVLYQYDDVGIEVTLPVDLTVGQSQKEENTSSTKYVVKPQQIL